MLSEEEKKLIEERLNDPNFKIYYKKAFGNLFDHTQKIIDTLKVFEGEEKTPRHIKEWIKLVLKEWRRRGGKG